MGEEKQYHDCPHCGKEITIMIYSEVELKMKFRGEKVKT